MQSPYFTLIYFFYGLAFFSMGLAITLELGHGSDERLRHAFRPMAVFGFLHGANEWVEMFAALQLLPRQVQAFVVVAIMPYLPFHFFRWPRLSISPCPQSTHGHASLLVPLMMVGVWGLGLRYADATLSSRICYMLRSSGPVCSGCHSLLAAGLIVLQRDLHACMAKLGQDSQAAMCVVWYGPDRQMFHKASGSVNT
jgi:hypothetical protein